MKKLSWRTLNDKIATLSEEEVFALLTEEQLNERRSSHLQRLHQRYCALRDARERVEIMSGAIKP
ncbi:hypothetical protein UFOVP370_44 [uncultured Caudovirales phage]|jgi:hypothetical protein|uniref:Uncharacterized protein n=1 Tax=uncultured Caudovirales phage TaxID=2100421 RepID=A0A6J7WYT6_9CAUD|nr:hypothetical protein UFOVP370_44 [uncultured Caudovirales phage]